MIDTAAIARAFQAYRAGRFQILRRVGHGGMGTVFEAFDSQLQRSCAIKVLDPKYLEDDLVVSRFRREARVMIKIDHPAIVRVYDLDEIGGMPFIVLEWIAGGTLSQFCQDTNRLSAPVAISVMIRVCEGIMEAHAQGIIHRDIKPANVLLAPRGEAKDGLREVLPKVTDFGIAKVEASQTRLTSDGSGMGSMGFWAPEQTNAAATVDVRADVHTLGVTLWTLLQADERPPGMFNASITADPRLLYGMPPALCGVIHKATSFRPEDRFQTVAEMRGVLQGILVSGASWGTHTSPFADPADMPGSPGELVFPSIPDIAHEATGLINMSDFPGAQAPDSIIEIEQGGSPRPASGGGSVADGGGSVASGVSSGADGGGSGTDNPVADTVMVTNGELIAASSPAAHAVAPRNVRQRARVRAAGVLCALALGGIVAFLLFRTPMAVLDVQAQQDATVPTTAASMRDDTMRREAEGEADLPVDRQEPEASATSEVASMLELPSAHAAELEAEPERAIRKAKREKSDRGKKHGKRPRRGKQRHEPVAKAETPEPAVAAVSETVRVGVRFPDGEKTSIWIVGSDGRHKLPATVPPGTYQVIGKFNSGEKPPMSALTLTPGKKVTLICSLSFERCQAK